MRVCSTYIYIYLHIFAWEWVHEKDKFVTGRGCDREGQRCQSHTQRTNPGAGYISALERQTGILSGPLSSDAISSWDPSSLVTS
jgi:hypothetical protein